MLLGGGGTWDEACTKNIAGFNLWLQLRRIGQGAVAYQGTDSGANGTDMQPACIQSTCCCRRRGVRLQRLLRIGCFPTCLLTSDFGDKIRVDTVGCGRTAERHASMRGIAFDVGVLDK